MVGGTDVRFGVFICFLDDLDVVEEFCVVDRKRFDDDVVVAVVLAPPIAVLTAGTVDEEFVN